MVQILQPADLSTDFANDGTNAQGGVTIVRSRLVSADAGNALVIGTDGGLRAPAAGTSATNLAYTAAAGGGTVTSDTGNDATLPLASTTAAGLAPPRSGAAADYLAGDGTYKTLPGKCDAAAISAAELLALDADPSTGKVTVCIPDGAGTKPVAVSLADLPAAGGGSGAGAFDNLAVGATVMCWMRFMTASVNAGTVVAGDELWWPTEARGGNGSSVAAINIGTAAQTWQALTTATYGSGPAHVGYVMPFKRLT